MLENSSDAVSLRLAAGVVGVAALATYHLARRRSRDLLPDSFTPTVAMTLFGAAGLGLAAISADNTVLGLRSGLGTGAGAGRLGSWGASGAGRGLGVATGAGFGLLAQAYRKRAATTQAAKPSRRIYQASAASTLARIQFGSRLLRFRSKVQASAWARYSGLPVASWRASAARQRLA